MKLFEMNLKEARIVIKRIVDRMKILYKSKEKLPISKDDIIIRTRRIYIKNIINELKNGKTVEIIVNGYSMVPTIFPGQRVLIIPYSPRDIKINDIIAYKLDFNSWITVHRVISIFTFNEKQIFKTKGDHIIHVDDYNVDQDCFLGIIKLI
jgi:signal peptidase I